MIPRTPAAYDYPLIIKNLFMAPVVDNPEQEIVYRDLYRFSYREFRARVHRLAAALTRMGVRPGDTVAVMDWDSHRYLECFFAVPMIGAVLHTVNIRLSPEQIVYTVDHAEDDYLLVNSEFVPIIEQIKGRLGMIRKFVLLTDTDQELPQSIDFAGEYEALLDQENDHFDFPDFDENTRATTFYTTGTTGMPKGVYFSHRQLVLHTLATLAAISSTEKQGRFHQNDVYMPITPMFHVHAWGFPYIATACGVKQVYPGKYSPNILLSLIEKEKVTFSHCVPTIMHMLMASPEFQKLDLSNWKVVIGGAALPKRICKAAMEKGIDIFTGYGMSETCPVLTLSHSVDDDVTLEEDIDIRCKTGRPLPLVQIRVMNDSGEEIVNNGKEVGEITVRAPWLTQGYWKDSRHSEELWAGGYLHTGDVASVDGEGYLTITDRIKDVIKIGGEWLSSLELEDIVAMHPAVSEVAVIGVADEKWGEKPRALIVLKEGVERPSPKEIVSHIRAFIDKGLMSKLALLTEVRYLEVIEKTSVGKVNKKLHREQEQTISPDTDNS